MNKIYVIVDMQNDFIYGRLGTEQSPIAFRNLAKRLETIPINSYVFFTQDTHFDDYLNTYEGVNLPIAHCVHATWGVGKFLKYYYIIQRIVILTILNLELNLLLAQKIFQMILKNYN